MGVWEICKIFQFDLRYSMQTDRIQAVVLLQWNKEIYFKNDLGDRKKYTLEEPRSQTPTYQTGILMTEIHFGIGLWVRF